MSMNMQEVVTFQNALNHPEKAMVKALQEGKVLDNQKWIEDAKSYIRSIEDQWIPSLEERIEYNTRFIQNYKDSEDGKQALGEIKTYKEWVKLLKNAIKNGQKVIEKKNQEKLQTQAKMAYERATKVQSKTGCDPDFLKCIVALAGRMEELDVKFLGDYLEPIIQARKVYRSSRNQIESLKDEGIKTHDLGEFKEDGLEKAYARVSGIRMYPGRL